jgi:putative FmdB family regulatory protein
VPIYLYACTDPDCLHQWEELILHEAEPESCPKCGAKSRKKLTTASHRFRAGVGEAGGWKKQPSGMLTREVKGKNTTSYGDGSV